MNPWEKHLADQVDEVLFDEKTIEKRVIELADEITADYQRLDVDELVIIGILRGSVLFMADLIRHIKLPVSIDFMAMSSYTHGTRTSGSVRILKDIAESITDKHVLIIEDIIDTGLTMQCLYNLLEARRPKSLKICTLLDKPSRRLTPMDMDYVGFAVPDRFVVGYGLDFDGHYRHLPFVAVLKPEAYQ